jgi:hypothetical protein
MVFLSIKFYGHAAHITMTIQAIAFAAFGIGILLHQRWGLILVLLLCGGRDQSHSFFRDQFQRAIAGRSREDYAIEGPIVFDRRRKHEQQLAPAA